MVSLAGPSSAAGEQVRVCCCWSLENKAEITGFSQLWPHCATLAEVILCCCYAAMYICIACHVGIGFSVSTHCTVELKIKKLGQPSELAPGLCAAVTW